MVISTTAATSPSKWHEVRLGCNECELHGACRLLDMLPQPLLPCQETKLELGTGCPLAEILSGVGLGTTGSGRFGTNCTNCGMQKSGQGFARKGQTGTVAHGLAHCRGWHG